MSDSKYCYPGTDVLINRFDIRDAAALKRIERDLTSVNIAALPTSPLPGCFDLRHLQAIHKAIFQDIYPFAGQLRTVAIAKSNPFCLPQYIEPMAGDIFDKLRRDRFLRGLTKEQYCEKLAFYSGEINALHPFREGNGRTQRIFLQELSKAAGYDLRFSKIDKNVLLHADIEAMKGNYTPLFNVYEATITPMEPGERTFSALARAKAAPGTNKDRNTNPRANSRREWDMEL